MKELRNKLVLNNCGIIVSNVLNYIEKCKKLCKTNEKILFLLKLKIFEQMIDNPEIKSWRF